MNRGELSVDLALLLMKVGEILLDGAVLLLKVPVSEKKRSKESQRARCAEEVAKQAHLIWPVTSGLKR